MDAKYWWAVVVAILSVVFVSMMWQDEILLTVVMLVLSIAIFVPYHDNDEVMLYFFAFFAGPLAESIAIHFGAWHYSSTLFFNVPLWLFPLWGVASVFMDRIHSRAVEILARNK